MGCSSVKSISMDLNSVHIETQKINLIRINQSIKCKPMLYDYNSKFPTSEHIDLPQMKIQCTPLVKPIQQVDADDPKSMDTVCEELHTINRSNDKWSSKKGILKSQQSRSPSLPNQSKRVTFSKTRSYNPSNSGFASPYRKSHKITMQFLEASF